MSSGFFALLTPARYPVKVGNRSGLTFFVRRAEADADGHEHRLSVVLEVT